MNVRPLNKQVLIRPVAAPKVSAGGIVLPGGDRGGVNEGKVLAVAQGVELEPGDHVFYGKHAPTTDAGDGLVLVHVENVLAKVG